MLQRIAIPDAWADWMLAELSKEEGQETAAREEQRRNVEAKLAECDRKLTHLLELHLDQSLTVDEYREAKAKVLSEKLSIKDQLQGERGGDISPWFEPVIRFVKSLKRSHFMTILDGKIETQRDFLKTTGSNWVIQEKTLKVEFKEPWKTLENHGRFAQSDTAALLTSAAVRGETDHDLMKAERGRFEQPPVLKLLQNLYLQLKLKEFKDLARLEDVLSLYGFLPSCDGN